MTDLIKALSSITMDTPIGVILFIIGCGGFYAMLFGMWEDNKYFSKNPVFVAVTMTCLWLGYWLL